MARRNPGVDKTGALSIGALSASTGIPAETIRTWERRYGFPVAERKSSGHRVYSLSTVPRLRRIAEALARGHRAAEVVPASEEVVESLLAAVSAPPPPYHRESTGERPARDATAGQLLKAVRGFDAQSLHRHFEVEWARLSAIDFLDQTVGPFLAGVGEAWSKGILDIRHEHFASALTGDFLRAVRGPLDEKARGPIAALTTLPGELHGLGLQMSALVFVLAGWRTLILGVNSPVEQIAALVREAPISIVALSCVQPVRAKSKELIADLRTRVPRRVRLVAGGAGAPGADEIDGLVVLPDLRSLDRWLTGLPR